MTQISARLVGAWVVLLFSGLGCSVDLEPSESNTVCSGPNCPQQDAAPPPALPQSDAALPPSPGVDADVAVPELCPGECEPDDPLSCSLKHVSDRLQLSVYRPAALNPDAGLRPSTGLEVDAALSSVDEAASADGGMSFASGDAAASSAEDADAAADGDSGSDGAVDGGYHPDLGTIVPPLVDASIDTAMRPSTKACQLLPDGPGKVRATCDIAGASLEGSNCISSSDCAPGLACVGDGSAVGSQCMNYCCEGDDSCPVNRFCSRRPLKTAAPVTSPPQAPLMVPVCAPSEQCDLMDPYPCPDDNCKCPSALACAPVGRDGARRCVVPGNGTAGEECPCDAGYFCSAADICLKLCQVNGQDCGSGTCQSIGGFPEQWGLCVDLPAPVNAP
jgi:hypothetical protein